MNDDTLREDYDHDEFNKKVNMEVVNDLYNKTATNTFEKIPDGVYIVAIDDMKIGETKTGKPALKVTFEISDGKFRNRKLYYTQVITADFLIQKALNFLRSLGTKEVVTDGSLESLKAKTNKIFEIIKDNCEFDLKYKAEGLNFPEYKIVGIYDLQ